MDNSKSIPNYYSNGIQVTMSLFDILIEFGKNFPEIDIETKSVTPKFEKEFGVFLSPQHFKAFVHILNDHLVKYEKQFGKINTPLKEIEEQ